MKDLQTEIVDLSHQRGYRFWIGRLALVSDLGLMAYYAYCWSLWGRDSLLLQYFFQCGCPAASNEARYPSGVEVVIPACQYASSILSPSGRLLYVQEEGAGPVSTYLLDLQTKEKIPFSMPEGSNYFLTDDLIFHGGDEYILDRMTGEQYPVQGFAYWRSDAYINGEVNLNVLVEALQNSKDVFLIDGDVVLAITQDFRTRPEFNFFIYRAAFPGRDPYRAGKFLQQNNIAYHYVLDIFPGEALSPDGRFIAREDGIYLAETGHKIIEGYSASGFYCSYSGKYFSVRGWTYDSSGALYSPFLEPCILETGFFIFEYPGCFIRVPQPLIKLKVPEEYLNTSAP